MCTTSSTLLSSNRRTAIHSVDIILERLTGQDFVAVQEDQTLKRMNEMILREQKLLINQILRYANLKKKFKW